MRTTSRVIAALVAAGALAAPINELRAQICAGYPTTRGEWSIGPRIGFIPEGEAFGRVVPSGVSFGAEASWNSPGPWGFFGNVNLIVPDDDEGENQNMFGAGVALELQNFVPAMPAGLQFCPVAAVSVDQVDGATRFTIPLGVGFGMQLPVTPGIQLLPYLIPQFNLVRISLDEVETDHNFGFEAGAFARLGSLYGGASFGRSFVEGATISWAFRAGITMGGAR
jgi:hypothetical protein